MWMHCVRYGVHYLVLQFLAQRQRIVEEEAKAAEEAARDRWRPPQHD